LFGPKYSGNGREAHRMMDHSIYSYSDLKTAYLERVHALHPDKCRGETKEKEVAKREFVQLKNAWNKYEELAKMMKRVKKGDETDASFTMFGVGCSFSDNDAERSLRNEFMDQACRGWLSSGAIGTDDGSEEDNNKNNKGQKEAYSQCKVSLCDDDCFMPHDEPEYEEDKTGSKQHTKSPHKLVAHLIRPTRSRS
jgi:hypothetical protein